MWTDILSDRPTLFAHGSIPVDLHLLVDPITDEPLGVLMIREPTIEKALEQFRA